MAESANILFGSPTGAIVHFTFPNNKMLRVTDCKKGVAPWMRQHISFHQSFFQANLKRNTPAMQQNAQGVQKQDDHEVITWFAVC